MDNYDIEMNRRNEIQAYNNWIAATLAIDLFNKKLSRRRKDGIGGNAEVRRLLNLRDIAVLEEQDAYQRWVVACNNADEACHNLHPDNRHPHA